MVIYNLSAAWFNEYTIFISVFVILLLSWSFRKPKNLPPGPWSLPLIGCVPSLAYTMYRTRDEPEQMLAKMADRYGEVFCLHIGPKIVVVANGYKAISKAFNNPLLNDRTFSGAYSEAGFARGISNSIGKSWITQRKNLVNIFRNFGVGRSSFEGSISTEAQQLLDLMYTNKNKAFDPHILIGNCVANVTCALVFGKRYDHDDPEFERILNAFAKIFINIGVGGIMDMFPSLRFVFSKQHKEMVSEFADIYVMMERIIKQHRDNFDETTRDDFIDVFLNEIEVNKNNESSQYINQENLLSTCSTLFIVGTETTASALRWALLYMMIYPDIQSNVQKELDDVIGRHRLPQWADRRDLPYTESVLLEMQRVRTIAPLGVPHCAAEDTTLAGYDIPKNAFVLSNIWAVHNDPDLWPEPDQFKPERFLNEDGKAYVPDEFIPFSTGRRMCPGENLAKMELFIFFTYMLHKFNIRKISPEHCYSSKGLPGLAYAPAPYEIVAESRD